LKIDSHQVSITFRFEKILQKESKNMELDGITGGLFWLTGASTGIGLAAAEKLAAQGAKLILSSRSQEKLSKSQERLLKLGADSVEVVTFDVAANSKNAADTSKFIANVLEGRTLDGLLLNAGGPKPGLLQSLDRQDFNDAHALLVEGPATFLLGAIPHLKHNRGSVVAITSTTVREPVGTLTLSAIYRSAFVVFLKNLAQEVGPLGLRLNNVGPGSTATQHLENLMVKQAEDRGVGYADVRSEWNDRAALKRLGTPEEIASAVVFLLSENASYISGQTLLVDGCSTKGFI
jgi:3-oxoacyl-[acyl-carrier protein] reductase